MCLKNSIFVCSTCGSDQILRDAWAYQNKETGNWELDNMYDDYYCQVCDGETSVVTQLVYETNNSNKGEVSG